jgi:hypothetical protein
MTVKRYEGKPMIDEFRYETDPSHPLNRRGWAVRRLDPAEQEQYRVVVGDDGLVRQASDGSLFDTQAATSLHSDEGGRAIFVMDENGNLYASNHQEIGLFHHSTLGNGRPAAAAGEIRVVNGRIDHLTAASGHYRPGAAQMQQLTNELGRHGVTGVHVYGFDGTTRWI